MAALPLLLAATVVVATTVADAASRDLRTGPSSQPKIAMTIALYTEPGPQWKRMATSARVHPSVPMTAIISPHHGDNTPGRSAEAGDNIERFLAHNRTWLSAMAELRAAGIQIQHYFHMRNLTCPGGEHKCGCGQDPECCLVEGQCVRKYRCCNDITNVGVITNQSITYFPQDGFFADNGAFGNHSYEQQMHTLTQVGATKPRPVLVNGGTGDEWALQHGMSVSSEFTRTCHKLPKFASKYSRDRFVAIVHTVTNASDMRRQVDNCIDIGFGNLGVVSDYTEAIPSYWEEQVAYIAKKNQEASPSAATSVKTKTDDANGATVWDTLTFADMESEYRHALSAVKSKQQVRRAQDTRHKPGSAAGDVMVWWSIEVDSASDTIADSLRRTAEAIANLSLSKFGKRGDAVNSPTISFSPFQVDYDVSIELDAAPIVRLSKQASYADSNITQNFESLIPLRKLGKIIVPLSVGGSCDPDTNSTCLADLTAFLVSPARRAAAVAELVQVAREKNFSGWNLDQETQMPYSVGSVSAALTKGWRAFLMELASSMRDVDPTATVSADICGSCDIADYMGMRAVDWARTGVEIASMCTYSNNSSANYTPPGGSPYNPFDGYISCLSQSYGNQTARVGLGQGIPTWNPDVEELKRQLRQIEGADLTKVAVFEAPSMYTHVEWLDVLYDWMTARKTN